MDANGAALLHAWHFGREHREIRGCEIEHGRGSARRRVQIEIGLHGMGDGLAVLAFRLGP